MHNIQFHGSLNVGNKDSERQQLCISLCTYRSGCVVYGYGSHLSIIIIIIMRHIVIQTCTV